MAVGVLRGSTEVKEKGGKSEDVVSSPMQDDVVEIELKEILKKEIVFAKLKNYWLQTYVCAFPSKLN